MKQYVFEWNAQICLVFFTIINVVFCFSIYWFVAQSSFVKNKFYSKHSFDAASAKHIVFTKYFGFITMGILAPSLLIFFFRDYATLETIGLAFYKHNALETIFWILGLSILVFPIVYLSAKKSKNLLNYPQIRSKVWTKKIMFQNALAWAAYLFGYELLFRGVLLFPLANELGVWIAIAINIALYAATHIPKGLDETIGAVPLGLVLCVLTLHTGTIWIAFFVHVFMAWTNSFTALKYHPEMKIV